MIWIASDLLAKLKSLRINSRRLPVPVPGSVLEPQLYFTRMYYGRLLSRMAIGRGA